MNIDCHRHFGGCITPHFVWEVIQEQGLKHLAETLEDVEESMQYQKDEPRDFHRFLDKFKILDFIPWNEYLIDKSVKCVCDGLETEGVDFAWMDFSINKYMQQLKWHKHQAIKFIYDAFEKYRPGKVGLILSLKYESTRASQRQYAALIDSPDVAEHLMGLDLVGDEGYFDPDFYAPIFKNWRSANKMVRAHVGESQAKENVLSSITDLGAGDIAHGFKIMNDEEMIKQAIDQGIYFHLAISSNYFAGVWTNPTSHPITDMLKRGMNVTLGSDDPVQCSTTLNREFELARERYDLSDQDCATLMDHAKARTACFVPLQP